MLAVASEHVKAVTKGLGEFSDSGRLSPRRGRYHNKRDSRKVERNRHTATLTRATVRSGSSYSRVCKIEFPTCETARPRPKISGGAC